MAYSPEQLTPLAYAVSQVVLTVIGADGSGPVSGAREVKAAMDFLKEAPAQFQGNALVQALVVALNKDDENNPLNSFMTLDEIDYTLTLTDLARTLNELPSSPDIQGVVEFIYDLAQRVAEAAGSGLFGMGAKVSEEESDFLALLAQTLGL